MIKRNIPNLLTCLNLTCGLLAIMTDDLELGVYLVIAGGIFDVFDGLSARILSVSSKIGGELDSLADVVSFGVAPAILFYKAFAISGQWWYLLGPIFIVLAGAIRLARFNVSESKSSYFEGLAIPATGLLLCGLVYARDLLPWMGQFFWIYLLTASLLASLNVSTFKLFSFKQFGETKIKVYFAIIAVIGLICAFLEPTLCLAVLLSSYILIAVANSFSVHEAA